MNLIEQEAYRAAQTILTDLSATHIAIAAVLDGVIDGEVWIDDPVQPQVAIVVNDDAYYLAGNPAIAIHSLSAVSESIPDWAYLFVEDRWIPHLAQLWRNPFALRRPRIRMGFVAGRSLPVQPPVPADFEIVPIDRKLFDRDPGNLDVLEDCVEGWICRDAFFDTAIGFCALHDGRIVSHSVTDSVCGSRCEVGVGTDSAFRGNGLGRAVVAATIAECVRRGRHAIEWHTHASNKGSLAIARAVGLVELDRHMAFSCRLPAENVGDLDPDHCLELAAHFERAAVRIDWCRFHAAGARALAGDREGALENVRLLIESDWEGEAEWLEAFWALQSLAQDSEFQALVARKRRAAVA